MNRWIFLMAMVPGLAWAGELVFLEGVGGDETAWAINEAGVIVGTSYHDDVGTAVPLKWTNEVLDVLDGPVVLVDGTECDLEWGDARNVTNSGEVIARVFSWCEGADIFRAATWDDDSRTWQAFPPPPGATFTFSPVANKAGHVLVSSDLGWTLYRGNKIVPANIPDGCGVYAMNTKGMIGGYCGDDAVLWYKGKQTILPSPGDSNYVRGMNDNGKLVGVAEHDLGDLFAGSAVSWPDTDTIVVVDDLGWATAINNRGAIVGAIGINGSDVDPLMPVWWDRHGNGPMYLAPGHDGVARDINDSGTIVGSATIDDKETAFVYYP